jgi:hypothetical protein
MSTDELLGIPFDGVYLVDYIVHSSDYYSSAKWLRVCGFWMLYSLHTIPGKLVIDRRRTVERIHTACFDGTVSPERCRRQRSPH